MKFKVIILTLMVMLSNSLIQSFALADSGYYSSLPPEEIEKIFSLDGDDIEDPWSWIGKTETFTIIEKTNDGKIQYWWNSPNIQMSSQNELFNLISNSGYGYNVGELASEKSQIIKLPKRDEAKTALQKYGFNIQNPTYLGERPIITISILGVLLPDNILDTASRLAKFAFSGEVVSLPTKEDYNSLIYAAPRDYNSSAITFKYWVSKNWYKTMKNMDQGQVLMSGADPSTGMDTKGDCWVKDNVITKAGLEKPGLSADIICAKLENVCGTYYADVCENIIKISNVSNYSSTERIMPYDLDRLNSRDKLMFDGIVDPRSEIQKGFFNTGYSNNIKNIFFNVILSVSSKLSEVSIGLNKITTFEFIENAGFDPNLFWSKTVLNLILFFMSAATLFYAVYAAFKVLAGSGSILNSMRQLLTMFLVGILIYSISNDPMGIYSQFKKVSASFFNISNVVLERQERVLPLYGSGDAIEKADCELWLPYFNMWTSYHTNHLINDKEQLINKSNKSVELKNLEVPAISGIKQNLWSTVLADAATSKISYPGNVYRMVDHFMAPRIIKTELNDLNKTVKVIVSPNENYNGNIQSSLNYSILLFQILILFVIFLKVTVFLELMIDIAMLVYNMSLSILDKNSLIKVFKDILNSIVNVFMMNFIVMLVVWASLISYGITGIVIAIAFYFIVYKFIESMTNGSYPFTPKSFRLLREAKNRTSMMFR